MQYWLAASSQIRPTIDTDFLGLQSLFSDFSLGQKMFRSNKRQCWAAVPGRSWALPQPPLRPFGAVGSAGPPRGSATLLRDDVSQRPYNPRWQAQK